MCQAEVALGGCEAKQRLGGKYASLTVPASVRAPEVIQSVLEELGRDPRVLMKY